MKNLLLPTDLLLKTVNSKAFIYLRVRAIIFLKNELCTEMNQACEYIFFRIFTVVGLTIVAIVKKLFSPVRSN